MPETDQQEQQEQQPPAASPPTPPPGDKKTLDLSELKEMNIQALNAMARELGVEGAAGMKKHDLIFKILQSQTEKSGLLFAEGVRGRVPQTFRVVRALRVVARRAGACALALSNGHGTQSRVRC